MSARVDQFCDNLRTRLNATEEKVQSLKTSLEKLPQQSEQALQKCLAETRAKVEGEKKKVEKAQASLKARAQQKVGEIKDAISQWKAKREVNKLHARADRAEQYAADAIFIADMAVADAEEAIVDALIARMDADQVDEPAVAAR
jgi:chromosome segregation ATPase